MKGYSLIVGVDELNERHYGVETYSGNAKTSAEAIHQYIRDETSIRAKEDDLFLDKNSIFNDIILRLEALADESKLQETFVFIFFVGHGTKYTKEEEQKFSFFKLFDQMLFENEFKNALKKFDPRTKLFCVCDFCYAGSYADKTNFIQGEFGIRQNKNLSYQKIINQYHNKISVKLDSGANCPTFLITSVSEKQFAQTNGEDDMYVFSYHLLSILKSKKASNYYELYEQLKAIFNLQATQALGGKHIPELYTFQSNTNYFINHKPFKI